MKPEKIATLNLDEVEIENDTLLLHFKKTKQELEMAQKKIKSHNNNIFLTKSYIKCIIYPTIIVFNRNFRKKYRR